jgi:hypothetical protein
VAAESVEVLALSIEGAEPIVSVGAVAEPAPDTSAAVDGPAPDTPAAASEDDVDEDDDDDMEEADIADAVGRLSERALTSITVQRCESRSTTHTGGQYATLDATLCIGGESIGSYRT